MARDKITEYDATASNNTVCGDVNIAENSALPSDMNNFAREIMSHLKEGLGSGTPLYVDQTNNRLGIGTSTPSEKLEINSGTGNIGAKIVSTDSLAVIAFKDNSTTDVQYLGANGDNLVFHAGASPSERMRINSSGNVGIGTSSPTAKLDLVDDNVQLRLANSTTGTLTSDGSRIQLSGNDLLLINRESANIQLYTADTERMRIDSSGNVGIGTTSPTGQLEVYGSTSSGTLNGLFMRGVPRISTDTGTFENTYIGSGASAGNIIFQQGSSTTTSSNTERFRIDNNGKVQISSDGVADGFLHIKQNYQTDIGMSLNDTSGSGGTAMRFKVNGSTKGEISFNTSSTTYATSSDHRLKENVVDMTDATTRLKQLQPKRFNFIADADTTVDGFLAHEVQSVVPEAITGTHNEVDGDGNPVYQGIDQSKLVPLLVKTIQELEARIVALETA